MCLNTDNLKQQNLLLFEAVSGSRAYGLALPHSDTDIKGVFYLPQNRFYGLDYLPQVNNPSNDVVYYELGRFIELLLQSNPAVLELLASPADCIRYRHPLMAMLKPEWFLSKQCRQTFAGYAYGQIKKARGLNKKIANPMGKEKKQIVDFCFIVTGTNSIPLQDWLHRRGWQQHELGLVSVPHAHNLYAVFHDAAGTLAYQGIMQKNGATTVLQSSIPENQKITAYLSFNQQGYSSYCAEYQSYWQWVAERNDARYQDTLAQGQSDAKNLMRTFRLLEMAQNIANHSGIRVRRPNRNALLAIRSGRFCYEQLITRAERLMQDIDAQFAASPLPETPDEARILAALIHMRQQLYARPYP